MVKYTDIDDDGYEEAYSKTTEHALLELYRRERILWLLIRPAFAPLIAVRDWLADWLVRGLDKIGIRDE